MREFTFTNAFELERKETEKGFISEKKVWRQFQMTRKTARKFEGDKVFYENNAYIVLVEGVIFNSTTIKKQHRTDLAEALIAMYQSSPTFFTKLDGSFSGYLFDKAQEKIYVFANKIGDHPTFYWQQDGKYIISTSIRTITRILQANGITCMLNAIGSYCLLTYGWMLQNITLIDGISRIGAGYYLESDKNTLKRYQYHEFVNTVVCEEQSETEMIDKLDALFKQALKKISDKNDEYGYQHVAQLSAGLDSRTVNYALTALGVKDMMNVSYSESEYYDQMIPMKISEELQHNWLFKSLDNGLSLFLLEEMVQRNDGLVLHYGPAQVWDMFSHLDRKNMGLIYNGIAGDVVAGDYCTENNPLKQGQLTDEANSKKLLHRLEKAIEENEYTVDYRANQEMFLYYNSCFTGSILGTPMTLQYDCESYSPFYDEDFFAYCLSIPLQQRWDYNLYDKWLMQKYPDATKYLHNGSRQLGVRYNIEFMGKRTNLQKLPKQIKEKILRKLNLKKRKINTKHHMNPIDYWYYTNENVTHFMDHYFASEIKQLDAYPEIQADCQYLYHDGNGIEKTQVLTLLAATKHLLGDGNDETATS